GNRKAPERTGVPVIETPVCSDCLSLEGQPQRQADGAAVVNVLLREAATQPPEVRVRCDVRDRKQLRRLRVNINTEAAKRSEIDVVGREQRVVENIIEDRIELQLDLFANSEVFPNPQINSPRAGASQEVPLCRLRIV